MQYIGIYFSVDGARKFWRIECPCGVSVEYPVNGLPEIDTPHPCGNADHWTVRYGPDGVERKKRIGWSQILSGLRKSMPRVGANME